MQISQATQVTDELVSALECLIPQLDPAARVPTREHLGRLLASRGCVLLVGREDSPKAPIVGMLTLAWYPIPTGIHAWIEDVVVDAAARGSGIGGALVEAALDRARREGAGKVDLTSRPERGTANRLYARLGFERRDTNVYRFRFDDAHKGTLR